MTKRKKKIKIEEITKQDNSKLEVNITKSTMPLHVYFSLKKIKEHRQAGMKVYKNAANLNDLSMEEWNELFKNY